MRIKTILSISIIFFLFVFFLINCSQDESNNSSVSYPVDLNVSITNFLGSWIGRPLKSDLQPRNYYACWKFDVDSSSSTGYSYTFKSDLYKYQGIPKEVYFPTEVVSNASQSSMTTNVTKGYFIIRYNITNTHLDLSQVWSGGDAGFLYDNNNIGSYSTLKDHTMFLIVYISDFTTTGFKLNYAVTVRIFSPGTYTAASFDSQVRDYLVENTKDFISSAQVLYFHYYTPLANINDPNCPNEY